MIGNHMLLIVMNGGVTSMKKIRVLLILSAILLLLAFLSNGSYACSNMLYGKYTTVDGSIILAASQDGWWDPNISVVPRLTFAPGEMVSVYENNPYQTQVPPVDLIKVGEIPQVENTYAYFKSAWGGFMNEHQIFVNDEYIYGREELSNPKGLPADELIKFGLQRAKTAREFIKVAGNLAEKYGFYNGGAEAWAIADPNEAWFFEIFPAGGKDWTPDSGIPGAVWVAQRVPDDEVSFNFNRSRIAEINLGNPDYFMASSNIFSLAEEMGWYDPDSGKPFIWWEAYTPDREDINLREWAFVRLIAPSLNPDSNQSRWPFSIKPDKGKLSVQEIMDFQMDNLEETDFDLTKGLAGGPFGSPDRYGKGFPRAINTYTSTYYFVAQARNWLPDPIGGLMWFCYDKADTGCFMPFYCCNKAVPASFNNQRRDIFDKDSAFWAFQFVSNWANLKYNYMIKDIREARQDMMNSMFTLQPAIEATALELYKKDPSLVTRFLTDYSVNTANKVVNYWWELGDKLVAKYVDGQIMGERSPGYPDWWLDAIK